MLWVPVVVSLFVQAPATDEDVAARFSRARQALSAGQSAQAVTGFREILRLRPELLEARVNLGLALFSEGDYQQAAAEMAQVLQRNSGLLPANLFAGLSYVKLGLPRKAIAPLQRVVDADPADQQARHALAMSYLALREYEPAATHFRALFQGVPDPEARWFGLGRSYVEIARDAVQRMTWEFRTSAWAHRLAADTFAERSEWANTEQEYRKALELAPGQPGLHTALAAVLRHAGRNADAAAEAARESQLGGIAIGPGCPGVDDKRCATSLRARPGLTADDRVRLGRALLRAGDLEPAADAFAAALTATPDHIEALYWLIRTDVQLSDTLFAKLIDAYPGSARAHQVRGELNRLRGAYDQAIAEYEAAARLKPDDPELDEILGELYLQSNSVVKAREVLATAEKLNPSSGRMLYLSGQAALAAGDEAAAIPYLEKAVRYAPNLLEAHAALGRLYTHAGRFAQAVPSLKKALSLDHYGDLRYLLYRCYAGLGQKDLAASMLAESRAQRKAAFSGDRARLAEINPIPREPGSAK